MSSSLSLACFQNWLLGHPLEDTLSLAGSPPPHSLLFPGLRRPEPLLMLYAPGRASCPEPSRQAGRRRAAGGCTHGPFVWTSSGPGSQALGGHLSEVLRSECPPAPCLRERATEDVPRPLSATPGERRRPTVSPGHQQRQLNIMAPSERMLCWSAQGGPEGPAGAAGTAL